MKIRFVELLPEQHALRLLGKKTPVARFEVEDGFAQVLAGSVHAFTDLQFFQWSAPLREKVLTALCAGVEEAQWENEEARTLSLAGRFAVSVESDARPWRVQGFTHLQTCDLKIIKHVLGVGSWDPEASVVWWAKTLGRNIEPGEFLSALEKVGCGEWKQLLQDRDPNANPPIRLYQALSAPARAECVRILAPLREGFQRAVYEALLQTSSGPGARHAHSREAGEDVMHFLDDRGLLVVARGQANNLSLVTAYDAHAEGEHQLGPKTLTRWFNHLQIRQRVTREGQASMLFHTPDNWRSLARTHGKESP
ncbi:hypothetical protein NR798_39775 [Archangium gephyra]|uniref:hypothetical protein n=1 Tax=Archangium gephyra TaxID=48 RepID=UPI0035D4BAC8